MEMVLRWPGHDLDLSLTIDYSKIIFGSTHNIKAKIRKQLSIQWRKIMKLNLKEYPSRYLYIRVQQIKLQLNITLELTFDIKKKDNKNLGEESCQYQTIKLKLCIWCLLFYVIFIRVFNSFITWSVENVIVIFPRI